MESIEELIRRLVKNPDFSVSDWYRYKNLNFGEKEVSDHDNLISIVSDIKNWNPQKTDKLRREQKELYELPAKFINTGQQIKVETPTEEEVLLELPDYWPDLKKLYSKLDNKAVYHKLYQGLSNWYPEE